MNAQECNSGCGFALVEEGDGGRVLQMSVGLRDGWGMGGGPGSPSHAWPVRRSYCVRAGYSILELFVVMSMVSIVLVAVAVTLQSLYRVDRDLRDAVASSGQRFQIAKQFRADVHLADSMTLLPDQATATTLRLDRPGGKVEYRLDGQRIIRQAFEMDRLVHQEVFTFGRQTRFAWRSVATQPARVSLEIRTTMGRLPQAQDAVRQQIIDATLALHRRPDA